MLFIYKAYMLLGIHYPYVLRAYAYNISSSDWWLDRCTEAEDDVRDKQNNT